MKKRKAGEVENVPKKKIKKPKKKRIAIENLVIPQVKLELPPFKLQNVVASKWVLFLTHT